MKNKAYLIVFENSPLWMKYYPAFHKQFTSEIPMAEWWHYLTSAYVIITHLEGKELSNRITSMMPVNRFMVIDITYSEINGYLPDEAWTWLRQRILKLR